MTDLQIFIVHENNPADAAWSAQLQSALEHDFRNRPLLEEKPTVRLVAGFEALPLPETLGALSPVLLVLPDAGRGFTVDEQSRLIEFRQSLAPGDDRIIPVPIEQSRAGKPPMPLDDIVAADQVDPANPAAVEVFATGVLNKLCLRVTGQQRSVFISYRTKHGQPWAEKITAGLANRGYQIWRDENQDRDQQKLIQAGSVAQETIQKAIRDHGFVLVIDTLGAHLSKWVDEEIQCAIKYSLPILPVVIDDDTGGSPSEIPVPPKKGGRFRALIDEQVEVRINLTAQHVSASRFDALDAAFFNQLEAAMSDRLLELLRTRRRLIHGAREQLKSLCFRWAPVIEEQLLFGAVYDCDHDETPGLSLRFLVQCVPYGTVMDATIANLASICDHQQLPQQYCLIVHQTGISPAEKRRLLRLSGGHVMVLQPDELSRIPDIISLGGRAST